MPGDEDGAGDADGGRDEDGAGAADGPPTVAVLGATGRTGVHVVDGARHRGWPVRALARSPAKVPEAWRLDDGVTVVEGDALDGDAVRELLEGTDAVVNALGHADGSPPDVLSRAVGNILSGMEEHDVDRLVHLTGAGVTQPDDEPGLLGRLLGWALGILKADLLQDSRMAAERIQDSDVDWTIVRAVRLTDGEPTGSVTAGFLGSDMGITVPRADVARFLLDEVEDPRWLREAPAVGA